MAKVPALHFEKHLNKQGIQPVYVFEGEDDALLSSCISALKESLETEDMPGSMTKDLEEVEDPRDVFDELHTQPFMGMEGKRLVIVRDGKDFYSTHKDALQSYLQSPSSAGILALCCEKLDRRFSAAKSLSKKGVVVDCSKIRWNQARSWVSAQAQQEGKRISRNALYALLDAVGPNVAALRTELEKLVLYADEQKTITEEHVEELVPRSRGRSVFDLSNAIIQGDVREAVRLGERLLLDGESPEGIVAFLGHRIRTLWQVRRMVEGGKDPGEISRETGIPRWAAKKSAQAVRNLTERWFARRIGLLARADVELKSTSVQSREQPVWLNRFLASLCER